jgi:hypothetical protein
MFHGLSDLEEVTCGGCFVADHDIFDDGRPDSFFCTKDGPPDYRREY